MKKFVEIEAYTHAELSSKTATFGFLKIAHDGALIRAEGEHLRVSDGYHTFDELYEHRLALFVALQGAYVRIAEEWGREGNEVWKSKLHSDGTMFGGWFVAGIFIEKGSQITYHLPLDRWDDAYGTVLERAPEWDGHTSADVLIRLKDL